MVVAAVYQALTRLIRAKCQCQIKGAKDRRQRALQISIQVQVALWRVFFSRVLPPLGKLNINMSISHSVLLVSVPTLAQLQSPEYLQDGIRAAVAQTRKSLLVIVFSPLFSTSLNRQLLLGPVRESLKKNTAKQWKEVQKLLTFIYVQSAKRAQELDNILLSVDVVLRDSGAQSIPPKTLKSYGADTWEHVFVLDGGTLESIHATNGANSPLTYILGWQMTKYHSMTCLYRRYQQQSCTLHRLHHPQTS